jgi:hypothetical protein
LHLAVQNTGRGGSGSETARAAQRQNINDLLAMNISTALKHGKGKSLLDCASSGWIQNLLSANAAES